MEFSACSSTDRGTKISNIVKNSNNDKWKANLAEVISSNDLLTRDFIYHHVCYIQNWKKYIVKQKETSQNNDIKLVAAELEFVNVIQKRIDSNEYIKFPSIKKYYSEVMENYGISNELSDHNLKKKLSEQVENIIFTPGLGSKPSLVHSKDAAAKAIHDNSLLEDETNESRLNTIFKCGKIIRKAIVESEKNPWTFDGSLKNDLEAVVPLELRYLIRWIIQGTSHMATEVREESTRKTCDIIGQHIIQEFKSDRQVQFSPKNPLSLFRSAHDTPLAVGISLHSYHNHRRKKEIEFLNKYGIGISYEHMREIASNIASTVQSNMLENDGVFVPSGLLKNMPITCSLDNIDAKVDTSDGHNTFHGTAIGVHQRIPDDLSQYETVSMPLKLDKENSKLNNIPSIVTELIDCRISGNQKPTKSPMYEHFKLGKYDKYLSNAENSDITWLLARFSQMSNSVDNNNGVPIWSAYNSLMRTSNKSEQQLDKSYSLPIINAPAHEWKTLITALETLYKLNKLVYSDNRSPHKVLVTLDMDLYKKAIKLEYLDEIYSEKWMLSPGGFHIVICALRCLGRTVEHSGIDEVWTRSLYCNITVTQIINGKHYNHAIQAHEITLEVLFNLWISAFLRKSQQYMRLLQMC